MPEKVKLDVLPRFRVGSSVRELKLFLINPLKEIEWKWNNDEYMEMPKCKDNGKFAISLDVKTFIHFKTPDSEKIYNDAIKRIENFNATQLADGKEELECDFEKFKEKFDAEFTELVRKLNIESEKYEEQKQKRSEEKKAELSSDKTTSEFFENVCKGQTSPINISFDVVDKSVRMLLTINRNGASTTTPIQKFSKPPSARIAWEELTGYLGMIDKNSPELSYSPDDLKLLMNAALADITGKYAEYMENRKSQQHNKKLKGNNKKVEISIEEIPIEDRVDGYYEQDGCIGYRKIRENEETGKYNMFFDEKANFTWEYLKEVHKEDGSIEYETEIICKEVKYPFTVNTEQLSDNKKFELAIKNACPKAWVDTKDVAGLRMCFDKFKKDLDIPVIKKLKIGWNGDKYIMPSITIDKDGIHENLGAVVEFPPESHAKYIDMKPILDDEFIKCGKHIIEDFMNMHLPYIMFNVLADTYCAPLITPLTKEGYDELRYLSMYRGLSGSRKSFLLRRAQSHFGYFAEKGGYITYDNTTMLYIQSDGQHFRDVLFLTDDLLRSQVVANQKQFNGMLHGYTQFAGRGLRTRTGAQKNEDPMNGYWCLTCENTVVDGAGNEGRCYFIDVPKLVDTDIEKDNYYRKKGDICLEMQKYYPGFMARYILWTLQNNWKDEFRKNYDECRDVIYAGIETITNGYRIAKMFALRYSSFGLFCKFMVANNFMKEADKVSFMAQFKEWMMTEREKLAINLEHASDGQVFIDILSHLIACGDVEIADITEAHVDHKKPVVAYKDDRNFADWVFILPEKSLEVVKGHLGKMGKKNQADNMDVRDISKEFKNNKLLKDFTIEERDGRKIERATKKITTNGTRVPAWWFDRETFGVLKTQVTAYDIVLSIPYLYADMFKTNQQPTYEQYRKMLDDLAKRYLCVAHETKHKIEEFESTLTPHIKMLFAGRRWTIPGSVDQAKANVKKQAGTQTGFDLASQ